MDKYIREVRGKIIDIRNMSPGLYIIRGKYNEHTVVAKLFAIG